MSGKKRKEMVPVIVVILCTGWMCGCFNRSYQKNDSVG